MKSRKLVYIVMAVIPEFLHQLGLTVDADLSSTITWLFGALFGSTLLEDVAKKIGMDPSKPASEVGWKDFAVSFFSSRKVRIAIIATIPAFLNSLGVEIAPEMLEWIRYGATAVISGVGVEDAARKLTMPPTK